MAIPLVQFRFDARREVLEGEFLYCIDCRDVHRVSDLDRAPMYGPDGTPRAVDDFQQFLMRHGDHRLRALRRSSDAEIHSHPRHDPMQRVCWEVSDGNERFVVSFGRDDLESPRRYSIAPGRLVLESEAIAVDAQLLRDIIDDTLYPYAAPTSRLDSLVETCFRRIAALPWEAFELVDEDREDPNVQLACLPDGVVAELAHAAKRLFAGPEGDRIAELLECDLRSVIPVVRLTRRYGIRSR